VANAAEDRHLVLLELHPGAATIPQATARQGSTNLLTRELYSSRNAFNDSDQGRAMGFTGSQPTQHKIHPAM
jgi:hypothetical protein